MKKLKIILLFSLLLIFGVRFYFVHNYSSVYVDGDITLNGLIKSVKYENQTTTIVLKAKEDILVKYYDYTNLKLGDKVSINGKVENPSTNKVFNLFNYKNYLLSKRIYKVLKASVIIKLEDNSSNFYKIKNKINERLNSINNSYLYTLILANNRIDDKIYETYQTNGVSHLFSISGMHISLFSLILLKIFNIFFKNRRISYFLTSIILLLYMFLIGTSSIIRSVLLFISIVIFRILNIKIKTIYLLLAILYILLLINPYYIYDVGFKYSFIISLALIRFNYLYNKKRYLIKLFLISLIAFLVSYPITVNNNFSINIFSPLINLIFVPLITFIVFPMSLLVFIFPDLNNFFIILTNFLEIISTFFIRYSAIISFSYINIYAAIVYYLILSWLLIKIKLSKIILMIVFFLLHYNIHFFNYTNNISIIDVGQGDSILIELLNKEVILIDTGGNIYYDLSKNTIIPYLNSLGIRKISSLIITHGDFDHMGSSINLVSNFKIDKVIFNNGRYNDLELELIKVLKEKKIKYYQNIQRLDMNNNKLYFLNNKIYDNENDNSNIVYMEFNKIKLLLMGDAGVEVEEDILKKYDLKNIDILKIGHHGSKTSSSKNFINSVNPKYSIISVGKNNRYGHPNKEVIDNLNESNIYRTDEDGSIRFKIKNNKLEIETCR